MCVLSSQARSVTIVALVRFTLPRHSILERIRRTLSDLITDLSGATVLIVDDDLVTLQLTSQTLKGLCAIKVAPRPSLVLKMVDSFKPNLLLLDVNMPEMDGYELLGRLREGPWADVPVIFLTARSDLGAEERGLSLGAVDFVRKPLIPSVLLMRVQAHLRLQLALQRESEARQRADELLEVILPPRVADELRRTGHISPRQHQNIAVIFCDVVGFTAFCGAHPASEVVPRLDALFTAFEQISDRLGVERTKTIGDCFMATVGLDPELEARHERSPLLRAVYAATEMCQITSTVVPEWSARAGVYIGPLVSGVVGEQRFQFDVWGDTVNVAARLCGVSEPGSIALTAEHWHALAQQGAGRVPLSGSSLGEVSLKGLGDIEVYEVKKRE